jgi:septation ring formation regulator EzrA
MGLSVKSFNYVEASRQLGRAQKKVGFIAQEVEKVCPECVSNIVESIPDIMQACEFIGDNTLLTTHQLDDSFINKTIRLRTQSQTLTSRIVQIKGLTVVCSNLEHLQIGDVVDMVGSVIDDFKVVEYDSLVALLTLHIQQQTLKLESLSACVAQLSSCNASHSSLS